MKIIDCFTFYNEIELLIYRLNILNDVVDYFVIVESTHTFVGAEKELYFFNNKHLFEKWEKKIIHIIVDDFQYKRPNININRGEQWKNENYQRNKISAGLNKLKLNNEDVIIITDVDEIPAKNILNDIKNGKIIVTINKLEMDFYYCNLNHKKRSLWPSARIISYEKYLSLSLTCNDIRGYECSKIENGGWHLSYFGDAQYIRNKIQNFSHQEFNNSNFTDIDKINKRLDNFSDIFDRDKYESHNQVTLIPVKDNNRLPYEYNKYLQKFILL
jgi:beta-1,4-mannosyl-glycoprotein beta-1,4-N-acetylglucosaminyltransferase